MKRKILGIGLLASLLVWGGDAYAQRGGDDEGRSRGRDRGGDRDEGDRDRGRGFGGGPPSRFGGGSPGGFRGGPPGGFGGGPPGGFGGRSSGGFGGRSSGGRGGFDPSSFIDRLDRNNNGVLEPDEMEGPAGMMISRLERVDSSIRPGRPIPMSKIKEAFEKMRDGGGGGGDDDDEGGLTAGTLVPGFGGVEMPLPVPGFGAAADLLQVAVTDEDVKRANDTMGRYDRNRNGFIDASEISSRWDGNPMDFDQNRDNRLSANEMAIRYARRRVDEQERRSERNSDRDRRSRDDEPDDVEVEDRFDGRTSYRVDQDSSGDAPGWFTDKDSDGDGQVRMSEYAKEWTSELVEEFYGYDKNFDGIITRREAGSERSTASYARNDRNSTSRSEVKREVSVDELDSKYLAYAERIISRNDKNSNGVLEKSEYQGMILDISPADKDNNGEITQEEYAIYLQSRASK